MGLVPNLARPGGNITGVSVDAGLTIWNKRLALLREAAPQASKVAFLASRAVWNSPDGFALRKAVQSAKLSLVGPPLVAPVDEAEYGRVFAAMTQKGADALVVGDQPEHFTYARLIVDLAQRARLPMVSPRRVHAELGGLMAYAFDIREIYRRVAAEIDQILKGTDPGGIPFYQVTTFDLVINLKTAKALGLTIPPALLIQANAVIE
jgi:putative ABC transport system substrate-binding protein